MKNDLNNEDIMLRDLIMSSAVDISKIDNNYPYPLVWDKNLNFIGHICFEDIESSYQPERLNPEARKGCDSLNFAVMQRERSEEIAPPTNEIGHEK